MRSHRIDMIGLLKHCLYERLS